ncbi:MAG TPA: hypothetical protein VGC44_15030 [Longimicrobiales bacterium]
MQRRITTPILLAFGLAACSADSATDALSPSFQMQPTPFAGSCELAIQPATPVSPGVIHQLDLGDCVLSHLGKSTVISDKIINLAAGTQITEMTLTAANGDILYANGSGTNQMVSPGVVAFQGSVTFEGGTGRFADATGTATFSGSANFAAGRSQFTASGSIAY